MKAFPFSDPSQKVFFVAEIGSNHNRSEQRLEKLIISAKSVGFDAVKLQCYQAEKLWAPEFPERIAVAKQGETPPFMLPLAYEYSRRNKIAVGCSVFNKEDATGISEYIDFLKISSYECLNFDLIRECKTTNLPLFISTGMCTRTEIYSIASMLRSNEEDALFHCVSSYPAKPEDARIDILKSIIQSFGEKPIGYSDHTCAPGAILAAINAGAKIIEMHFDLGDLQGAESKYGHCWPMKWAEDIIKIARQMTELDLPISWIDNFSSRPDRKDIGLRMDNSDGMRPQLSERKEKENG